MCLIIPMVLLVLTIAWLIRVHLNPPTPLADRRQVPLEDVVMVCPSCGEQATAKTYRVEVKQPGPQAQWQMTVELCVCGACGAPVEAATMEFDEQDILRIAQWRCPRCNTSNSQLGLFCSKCHKPNPTPYVPRETEMKLMTRSGKPPVIR